MAMLYNTSVEITLEPIGNPEVQIQVGEQLVHTHLNKEFTFRFNKQFDPGTLKIIVEMINKSDTDSTTAIIIKDIILNGIKDQKFVWAGTYYPSYPQPWASTQKDLKESISNSTYLGWNGIWELDVTVPVFTWIHQTRGLGWIFE
jgi:hypothetical protein